MRAAATYPVTAWSPMGRDIMDISTERLAAAALPALPYAVGIAAVAGLAWLIGVQRHDTLLDGGHARAAFAAVKQAAGPRMQVRTIKIARDELTVLAFDPDMSQWRYVSGTRQHSGHWYNAGNIFEQSWRVRYWTVFGHDWYHVDGPTPEGIIQQKEGRAFDVRPEDVLDTAEVLRRAAPDPKLATGACALTFTEGEKWWTVCLDTDHAPLLVFLEARLPAR